MPSPTDPHDPRFEFDRQDNLVLLALGEPVPAEFHAHQADCTQCRRDLAALGKTVRLARESTEHRPQLSAEPPASVWTGIAAELALAGSRRPPATARRHGKPWRYLAAAAAALLIGAAGAAGGYLAGRSSTTPPTASVLPARLGPLPGGPPDVAGRAAVHRTAAGAQLSVATTGLPLRHGYYEVWLYDPTVNNMVAVGVLGDGGRGTFTLPAGIDLQNYHVVDVSAQNYTGGSVITHAQSVLRGQFTQ